MGRCGPSGGVFLCKDILTGIYIYLYEYLSMGLRIQIRGFVYFFRSVPFPFRSLLLLVSANIQYSSSVPFPFRSFLLKFCSWSQLICNILNSSILHCHQKRSKIASCYKSKIIEKHKGFTLFLTSRGAQYEV